MSTKFLEGKTALVTGAAVRLGRATAVGLASAGARLVIHYGRSAQAAQELAQEIAGNGTQAWPLQADLERAEELESLVPRALELTGGLDILVNNASIFPADSLKELELGNVVHSIQVNAWAPFVLSRSFAQHVERGQIVNFLDTRVAGYDWKHVSYIISKNVLALLTRMTALELAPDIAVNAVAPGLILPPPGKDESHLEALKHTVPLKRRGDAEGVVDAVLFLLKSDFITGQVIYVDGGRHLMEYPSGSDPD